MKTITGLSATPLQRFQVPINNGTVEFVLKYQPATQTWFIDLFFGEIEIYNTRVCHNLNLLAQYSDIINFGLYVNVDGIIEPVVIDDFSTGRAILNVLTKDEVDLVERGYSKLK